MQVEIGHPGFYIASGSQGSQMCLEPSFPPALQLDSEIDYICRYRFEIQEYQSLGEPRIIDTWQVIGVPITFQ
jgi:hypothetical protein